MQVFDLDAAFQQIIGKVLGHLLGERGDERTFVPGHTILDFGQKIVDLPFHGPYVDLRINKACRTDDLFHHTITQTQFVIARRRGQIYGLADALQKFRPFERTIVHCGGQTEAVLHQGTFSAGIPLIHGTDLRHGDM